MPKCDHIVGYEDSYDEEGGELWHEKRCQDQDHKKYLDVVFNFCPLCGVSLEKGDA